MAIYNEGCARVSIYYFVSSSVLFPSAATCKEISDGCKDCRSGFYQVYLMAKMFNVYCDMKTDGGRKHVLFEIKDKGSEGNLHSKISLSCPVFHIRFGVICIGGWMMVANVSFTEKSERDAHTLNNVRRYPVESIQDVGRG